MEVHIYKALLIILTGSFLLERLLDYLNTKYWSDEIPAELEGIYSKERYEKSQKYEKEKHAFGIITDSASFVVILLMIVYGGFALLDQYTRSFSQHPVVLALLFFGVLGFLADLLGTPFSLYNTFVIEEKFGFNKTTLKIFVLDKMKSWGLGIIIGGGLISLIVYIYEIAGNSFWIYAFLLIAVFMIFMTFFYSTLIVPVFNKQKPLEEGELKTAIEELGEKLGFRINKIFVMDGSKRSSKANAYFSGFGRKKRIVLFDTLIEKHSKEELLAILAHEIGHYKKKHIISGMLLSLLQTALMLFILSLFIEKGSDLSSSMAAAIGSEHPSFHLGVIAFGILYSPLSLIIGLLMNTISRKNEYQADRYAGEKYAAEPLMDALKKLSVDHLSNLRPHPLYVFFYYSHPTLMQRLRALKKTKSQS